MSTSLITNNMGYLSLFFGIIFVITVIVGGYLHFKASKKKDDMANDVVLKNKANHMMSVALLMLFLTIFALSITSHNNKLMDEYEFAVGREEAGDYELAYSTYSGILEENPDFLDVDERMTALYPVMVYNKGMYYIQNQLWDMAALEFTKIPEYENAKDLRNQCWYYYVKDLHPDWE